MQRLQLNTIIHPASARPIQRLKFSACNGAFCPPAVLQSAMTFTTAVSRATRYQSTQANKAAIPNVRMSPTDDGYNVVRNRNPDGLGKILLLSTSINSLTTAVQLHLTDTTNYTIDLAAVNSSNDIQQIVGEKNPDLVICPYLTKKIPAEIYNTYNCWIVHPGIVGDRGAYSLDYALLGVKNWKSESQKWGVTILQASEEYDAGAIWSTKEFLLHHSRCRTKSELYHTDVTRATIKAIDDALDCYRNPDFMPTSLENYPSPSGYEQTPLTQNRRKVSWLNDTAETIAQAINAATGQPGLKTILNGEEYYLYNACIERSKYVSKLLTEQQKADQPFRPGEMVLKMHGGVLFATKSPTDFIWVAQMKKKGSFKLPAEEALKQHSKSKVIVENLPAVESKLKSINEIFKLSWKEIDYKIDSSVGVAFLQFNFPGGAMNTSQANRLKSIYDYLSRKRSDVNAIVLMGGEDNFSNGIHLNVIHNASDPVEESKKNINAINDLTKSILNTTDKLTVSFIRCGAAAGGVMLSLASDIVLCDSKAVLHPYYKHMGLFGSEYWTYSLPRRVGKHFAEKLTSNCNPVSARFAKHIGLVDQLVDYSSSDGISEVQQMMNAFLYNFNWKMFLNSKKLLFDAKAAEECRAYELKKMYDCFQSNEYKTACKNFVH